MSLPDNPVFGAHGTNLYFNTEMSVPQLVQIVGERLFRVPPHIRFLVVVGAARTGTTVLQVLASQLPPVLAAEFQPFKFLLRHGQEADSFTYQDFHINGQPGVILLKETIGPERTVECTLDPVEILVQAGINPARLSALYILRDPRKTFYSWNKFVVTTPEKYKLTQDTIMGAYERDCRRLARCVPFYYEAFAANPSQVLTAVFRAFDLPPADPELRFDPDLVRSKNRWNEGAKGYYWDNVIGPMVAPGRFTFVDRSIPDLSPEHVFQLESLLPAFGAWRQLTNKVLGLSNGQ